MLRLCLTCDRFELWVRQSCPHPYSDPGDALVLACARGPVRPLVRSLVYSAEVDGLTPYSKYEFQLSVVNDAGPSRPPAITFVTTLTAGA